MGNQPTNQELFEVILGVQTTNQELFEAIQGVRSDLSAEIQAVHKDLSSDIQDVITAVQEFSTNVDQRFTRLESEVGVLKTLKTDVTAMRATMVTKAYLDDKLADEGVRYGGMIRETNEKIHAFVDATAAEGSLSERAASKVRSMRPFPRRASR